MIAGITPELCKQARKVTATEINDEIIIREYQQLTSKERSALTDDVKKMEYQQGVSSVNLKEMLFLVANEHGIKPATLYCVYMLHRYNSFDDTLANAKKRATGIATQPNHEEEREMEFLFKTYTL